MRIQAFILFFFLFAAGCTVQLYPPVKKVEPLPPAQVEPVSVTPDGGVVMVNGDTIPQEYSARKRFYWEQIEQSDSTQSFAVTNGAKDGRWVRGDSMRWHTSGPFITVMTDTVATRAYARANGGSSSFFVTGDNAFADEITDGQTLDISGSNITGITTFSGLTPNTVDIFWAPSLMNNDTIVKSSDVFVVSNSTDGNRRINSNNVFEWLVDTIAANVIQAGDFVSINYDDSLGIITISNTGIGSFNWGDGSTTAAISDGQTIQVTGGTGINALRAGNDVDLTVDFSELGVELTTDPEDYFVLWDSTTGAEEIATSGTVEEWIEDNFGNNVIQAGTNVSVSYSDTLGTITISATDTDTQLSNEQVQDIVGAMVSGNTESGITVTYDDAGNSLDFVVTSTSITSFDWGSDSGNTTITDGETIRVLGSNNGIDVTGTGNDKTVDLDFLELGAGIGVSTTDDYFIAVSSVGTEKRYQGEEVKDWIGQMVSGNTESGITVTYQAADQTFDFSVTDNSATNEAWTISDGVNTEEITAADGNIIFTGSGGVTTSYNTSTNTMTITGSGTGMTSWTWGGDVSTTSITNGETVRVQADAGLDAILSGNIVTISYDFNELSSIGSTPSTLDKVLLYDFSTSSYRQMAASGFVSPILEAAGEIRFDNSASEPTGDQGDVFYDTDDDKLKLYTAAGWKLVALEGSAPAKYSGFTEYTTTTSISPIDGAIIFCDPIEGASSFTLTLNPANLSTGDRLIVIANTDASNILTVATSGAQVFYGVDVDATGSTLTYSVGGGIAYLFFDGTDFFVLDHIIP